MLCNRMSTCEGPVKSTGNRNTTIYVQSGWGHWSIVRSGSKVCQSYRGGTMRVVQSRSVLKNDNSSTCEGAFCCCESLRNKTLPFACTCFFFFVWCMEGSFLRVCKEGTTLRNQGWIPISAMRMTYCIGLKYCKYTYYFGGAPKIPYSAEHIPGLWIPDIRWGRKNFSPVCNLAKNEVIIL